MFINPCKFLRITIPKHHDPQLYTISLFFENHTIMRKIKFKILLKSSNLTGGRRRIVKIFLLILTWVDSSEPPKSIWLSIIGRVPSVHKIQNGNHESLFIFGLWLISDLIYFTHTRMWLIKDGKYVRYTDTAQPMRIPKDFQYLF